MARAPAAKPAAKRSRSRPEEGMANRRHADALHALGHLYLTQGYPKQGLSLLLAAMRFSPSDPAVTHSLAYAYLLSGSPKKALATLDRMERGLDDPEDLRAAAHLRARALLAMGRDAEAIKAFDHRRRIG